MKVYGALPFSEAINKQVGDYLACGGRERRILEVKREGRNWPYFRLEGINPMFYLCADYPGFVSWQLLGDARPERAEVVPGWTTEEILAREG